MKACLRCGRLINQGIYCIECSLSANKYQYQCSFCNNTIRVKKLFFNQETNKIYCETCLNDFTRKLYEQGLPDEAIMNIMRRDIKEIK